MTVEKAKSKNGTSTGNDDDDALLKSPSGKKSSKKDSSTKKAVKKKHKSEAAIKSGVLKSSSSESPTLAETTKKKPLSSKSLERPKKQKALTRSGSSRSLPQPESSTAKDAADGSKSTTKSPRRKLKSKKLKESDQESSASNQPLEDSAADGGDEQERKANNDKLKSMMRKEPGEKKRRKKRTEDALTTGGSVSTAGPSAASVSGSTDATAMNSKASKCEFGTSNGTRATKTNPRRNKAKSFANAKRSPPLVKKKKTVAVDDSIVKVSGKPKSKKHPPAKKKESTSSSSLAGSEVDLDAQKSPSAGNMASIDSSSPTKHAPVKEKIMDEISRNSRATSKASRNSTDNSNGIIAKPVTPRLTPRVGGVVNSGPSSDFIKVNIASNPKKVVAKPPLFVHKQSSNAGEGGENDSGVSATDTEAGRIAKTEEETECASNDDAKDAEQPSSERKQQPITKPGGEGLGVPAPNQKASTSPDSFTEVGSSSRSDRRKTIDKNENGTVSAATTEGINEKTRKSPESQHTSSVTTPQPAPAIRSIDAKAMERTKKNLETSSPKISPVPIQEKVKAPTSAESQQEASTAEGDETPESPRTSTEITNSIGKWGNHRQIFEHPNSGVPDWARRSSSRSNSPRPGVRPSTISRQSSSRSNRSTTPTTSPKPGYKPGVTSRQSSSSSLKSLSSARNDSSRSPTEDKNRSSNFRSNQGTFSRRHTVTGKAAPSSVPLDSEIEDLPSGSGDPLDGKEKGTIGRSSMASGPSPGMRKRLAAFSAGEMKSPPLPMQTGMIGTLMNSEKNSSNKDGRSAEVGEIDYGTSSTPMKATFGGLDAPPSPSPFEAQGEIGTMPLAPSTPPLSDPSTASDMMPFLTPKRSTKNRDSSQFSSSKNALIEALTTPARKKKEAEAEIQKTPRTLKRGYVALNIATPKLTEAKTPGQRFMDHSHHGRDKANTYIDSALGILNDKSKTIEIENLVWKIEELGGFPKTRRLSMRDNELVGQLVKAVRNDPGITKIHVDSSMFGTISSTLLSQFIGSLRINLHVRSLSLKGAELGNDFLYELVASLESNFVVEEIDLSTNCFTNEGLANFCMALATTNDSVKHLNLRNQTTAISEASEVDVLEALEHNTTLTKVEIDFMSEDGPQKVEKLLERNRHVGTDRPKDLDQKLLNVLTYEAERAQELWEQKQAELNDVEDEEYDWEYLHKLALLFDKHKLKKEVEENAKEFTSPPKRTNADDLSNEEKKKFLFGEFKKNMEESVIAFNQDGSFLTPEFIAKFFKERDEEDALDFDFHGQWKLFKRFPIHDPARQLIVNKFVDAIVTHPRANEITGINMANTGAGDDFLQALAHRCLEDSTLLSNLHTVNFETNFINEPGVVALADMIASPETCKYMQVIRLENQKGLLKSKAEFALARALRMNRSIVVVSLTIRNLLERERIGKYVMRNVDLLRQARLEHMKATGTQRKRNKVEQIFDSVRENDENLTTVNMMGNERFLTLTREEKTKAARSFERNNYVRELFLNGCGIDDDFAQALGESLTTNTALERVHLEKNDISGEGIKAIFSGVGKNGSIKELRLHKQSRLLASADEEHLADLIEENMTITKIGMDLRSKVARIKLDRKTGYNINLELKGKAAAKGGDYVATESFSVVKF